MEPVTRYFYGADTEIARVEVDARHVDFYFKSIDDLLEQLFLAGFGEQETEHIVCDVTLARENGWGDDPSELIHPVAHQKCYGCTCEACTGRTVSHLKFWLAAAFVVIAWLVVGRGL